MPDPESALVAATDLVTVAAVQMVSTPSVEENLAAARRLITLAKEQGAALVCLPEYFCILGRRDTDKVAVRERPGDGPIQQFLSETARKEGIWLIGGTVPLEADTPEKVRNTTLVFDPAGIQVARYDKIHLFSFTRGSDSFEEARTIEAGRIPQTFVARIGGVDLTVGLSICYDVRFPELYRALGDVSLTVVPSAFTYVTGQAHWEILLRARAIENQCYVLAAAQGGVHPNGRRTWGQSLCIDPWGGVQSSLAEGEGVVIGRIDPTYLKKVRAELPALLHRTL
ncbi:MAG: carbon-nitrogen hydrolase family protein [Burkholderiaceae bacterium]|jgi:nitrilase